VPLGADELAEVRVGVNALVRDARGLVYRVESDAVPMEGPGTTIVLPLEPASTPSTSVVAQVDGRLDGPVELVGLGIDVWLPHDTLMTGGSAGVTSASASGAAGGPWIDLPLTSTGAWSGRMAAGRDVPVAVPADHTQGTVVEISGDGPQGVIFGNGMARQADRVSFVPSSLASIDEPVPVIANNAFLAANGSASGDTITARVDGAVQRLVIAGVVDAFPATDPERPLLIFDEPTLGLLRLRTTGDTRNADEWWMTAVDGQAEALTATLGGSPFDSTQGVNLIGRERSLGTDPVALGIIGALMLGALTTGLFAIVGIAVSAAVSARERRPEFALLRALGLSGRQLSSGLWLENGSLLLVSLVVGTSLGLLTAWLVLPFVTVTQAAVPPVPPPTVEVPWDRILALDIGSAIALGAAVAVVSRILRRIGVGSVLRMGQD
jgi:hypothetical protein